MKKLFIIPAMLICMTGATSNKLQGLATEPTKSLPISTKVDSLNVKAMELNRLIRQAP